MAHYRYFLCLLPSPAARQEMDALRQEQGWLRQIVEADRLHMTLAVLTETDLPWRDCSARLSAALEQMDLPACTVRLDRLQGGMLVARDRLSGVHRLRGDIVHRLLRTGLPCRHRPARLHVTLSYAAGKPRGPMHPVEWRADGLTLIESHHGQHRHMILEHWPLSERHGYPPPARQLDIWPDDPGYGPPTNAPRSTSSSTSPSSSPSQ